MQNAKEIINPRFWSSILVYKFYLNWVYLKVNYVFSLIEFWNTFFYLIHVDYIQNTNVTYDIYNLYKKIVHGQKKRGISLEQIIYDFVYL
jgi:hypothetical protein